VQDNQLKLELSSGPLPCPPEKLSLTVTEEDRRHLLENPFDPGSLEKFGTMVRDAFGSDDFFAAVLTRAGQLSGVLVQPSQAARPGEKESLQQLASQINTLLDYADVFDSMFNQAMLDDLTGLFNHRYLTVRLPQEVARASRHGHPLSVLFCDVDDFAAYTENNGRISGYSLLAKVATMLKARTQQEQPGFSFRTSDVPVRYGLEQFVVLLPETPKQGAVTKAERLLKVVESENFPGGDTQPLGKVSLSIGIATFPEDAADAVSVLEAADLALNQARERGKNRLQTS
jgi:diguanylate cyclase (GGDEF)-like protein